MSYAKNQANYFSLEHIGWKYYNQIRKKAVEQEFSWSGLLISLSIAFFVVALSAFTLNIVSHTIAAEQTGQNYSAKNISQPVKIIRQNLA